jgi:potassium efflux system protein
VPDPSLGGRVKHRLFAQIQRRFDAEGVEMPLPTQKLLVKPFDVSSGQSLHIPGESHRVDPASRTPPLRHWPVTARVEDAVDEGHRAVDE